MTQWSPLKRAKLNKACIVAPAYGVSSKEEIKPALDQLDGITSLYGITPVIPENMLAPGNHSLFSSALRFSNTDEVRLTQFLDALYNPECSIIWAFRGGYGSVRLLPDLYKIQPPEQEKLLVGFSDITILHMFVNLYWGWPSLHFGMPGALPNVMKSPQMIESMTKIIYDEVGPEQDFIISQIICQSYPELKFFRDSNAGIVSRSGYLIGSNSLNVGRMFAHQKFELDLSGKILLLEDVGISPRDLEKFFIQLEHVKGSNYLVGIIFGDLSPMSPELEQVIEGFNKKCGFVYKLNANNTIGHGAVNVALPLGVPATIACDHNNCKLTVSLPWSKFAEDHHRSNPGAILDILPPTIEHAHSSKVIFLNDANHHSKAVFGVFTGGELDAVETNFTKGNFNLSHKFLYLWSDSSEPRWLDGALIQLTLMKNFNELSGIIFGPFSPTDKPFIKVQEQFAAKAPIPVFREIHEGYDAPPSQTICDLKCIKGIFCEVACNQEALAGLPSELGHKNDEL